MLFYLIKNHCFIDGNKRVGWAACMEALRSLGLTINATDEGLRNFALTLLLGRVVLKTPWTSPCGSLRDLRLCQNEASTSAARAWKHRSRNTRPAVRKISASRKKTSIKRRRSGNGCDAKGTCEET
jgi:hypothetical protein